MPTVTLLLPALPALRGDWPPALSKALGRADHPSRGEAGERAQLLRHFDLVPRGWAVAALTRQVDVGDAGTSAWVRADPAWVRPEMTGARLFACSDGAGVEQADVDAFLPALQPLFGDAGFALDAPVPSRWYLRVPRETPLPAFVDPSEALGTDVFEHLSGQAGDSGTSRRWRALLNDAQIVLHNHPRNARRVASGRPPINSLWFWGGGALPDKVTSAYAEAQTSDATLHALSAAAGMSTQPLAGQFSPPTVPTLIDLRSSRSMDAVASGWILPAIRSLGEGNVDSVLLDLEDGARFLLLRSHRWRVWRKPLASAGADARTPLAGTESRQ